MRAAEEEPVGDVVEWRAGAGGERDLELERRQPLQPVDPGRRRGASRGHDALARATAPMARRRAPRTPAGPPRGDRSPRRSALPGPAASRRAARCGRARTVRWSPRSAPGRPAKRASSSESRRQERATAGGEGERRRAPRPLRVAGEVGRARPAPPRCGRPARRPRPGRGAGAASARRRTTRSPAGGAGRPRSGAIADSGRPHPSSRRPSAAAARSSREPLPKPPGELERLLDVGAAGLGAALARPRARRACPARARGRRCCPSPGRAARPRRALPPRRASGRCRARRRRAGRSAYGSMSARARVARLRDQPSEHLAGARVPAGDGEGGAEVRMRLTPTRVRAVVSASWRPRARSARRPRRSRRRRAVPCRAAASPMSSTRSPAPWARRMERRARRTASAG